MLEVLVGWLVGWLVYNYNNNNQHKQSTLRNIKKERRPRLHGLNQWTKKLTASFKNYYHQQILKISLKKSIWKVDQRPQNSESFVLLTP
jgi:hypothetical protein